MLNTSLLEGLLIESIVAILASVLLSKLTIYLLIHIHFEINELSKLPSIIVKGVAISVFMTFVSSPIATFSILSWFKITFKQQIFISWVGLRGATSIVL